MNVAQPRVKAEVASAGWLNQARTTMSAAWGELDKRVAASTLLAATAMTAFFFARYYYPWAPLGLAALAGAWAMSPKRTGPKLLFFALTSIPVAWAIAAIGSRVWGFGLFDATVTLALWWGMMLALYTVAQRPLLLSFLVPTWLLQASVTIRDGVTGVIRSPGLSDSPNVSGGFLVLGIVYLMTTRFRWLALPLMVALPFTGSRWSVIILALILAGMVLHRTVKLRQGALIVASAIILTLPWAGTITEGYRLRAPEGYRLRAPEESGTFSVFGKIKADLRERVVWIPDTIIKADPRFTWSASPSILGVAPMGFMGANGVHSVPERMLFELGLVPLAIWSLVGLWALWSKPRHTPSWWMLLAFLGLCGLDYYAWMPFTISAFWWVLVGMRSHERT